VNHIWEILDSTRPRNELFVVFLSSHILWSASDEVTISVFHILPASSFPDLLPFDALLYEVLAASLNKQPVKKEVRPEADFLQRLIQLFNKGNPSVK